MKPTRSNSKTVLVILHPDREIYSIGVSIRPRLQIQNHNHFPIEIFGFIFSWDQLAFSSPNAAYLIGPNGQDLLLQYRRSTSYTDYGLPIKVEGGGEEWLYLPISSHLHLRQLGEYMFWLEVLDNLGELHRSNQINFRLVDVESSVPPQLIELTIKPRKSSFEIIEAIDVETVFTNKSEQSIIFLKPQEDSLDGWVNPMYQFTVVDSADRSLALTLRCGSMATPIYNDSTKFIIASGEFYRQTIQLPLFPEMQNPGEYRIRLTYIVRDKAIGKGGVVLDKKMNWEKNVFVGRLESNEVTITIKGGV